MRPWRRWTDRLVWLAAAAGMVVLVVGLATAPPVPADRVEEIASRIRCPVCQSVSVAESPSDQARDMREIIAEQVAEGRSDEEIVVFFVDRYGEWIILAPPPRGGTLALWLLPPAAVLIGVILGLGRRRRLPRSRRQGDLGGVREPTQAEINRRYDRLAPVYDLYDLPMELLFYRRRRSRLLGQATGKVLEVGIGTGRNLPHYPTGVAPTGIDMSPRMLARAERRARRLDLPIRLISADIHHLPFPDQAFDTAAASFVFCSVADPVIGLRELGRVVRPEGRILLLEHVRPRNPLLARFADLLTPLTRRLFGFALNRRTEENIERAGLVVEEIRRWGIWREIRARPPGDI